jgi:hypothetical protein
VQKQGPLSGRKLIILPKDAVKAAKSLEAVPVSDQGLFNLD